MKLTRRQFIKATAATGAATVVTGGVVGGCNWFGPQPTQTSGRALIAGADAYGPQLVDAIQAGLKEFPDFDVRGKSVLLKPNLVETTASDRPINTHPHVVAAAADAFRRMGAARVTVADGPGHRRDIELVLAQCGLGQVLQDANLEFVDLNHDRVQAVRNRGKRTEMDTLYLPATVMESDVIVSLAKMKTHHWAGATLCMKNFFGLMPGVVYGWPKNVLHQRGIPQSIVDIVETMAAEKRLFGIIDGIVGMEGDGPIMGEAKKVGCLVMSDQFASADATAAAIMGFQPHRIDYMLSADRAGLGGTNPAVIQQRGERIERFKTDFQCLPQFNPLKRA